MSERKEKFTPGPWRAVASTHNTATPRIVVIPGNAKLIAQHICDCGFVNEADAIENGHLIAASPDLYAELQRIDPENPVLAKARGEA